MKKVTINRESLTFYVPIEGQEQNVEISYAMTEDGNIVRRQYDRSSKAETAELFEADLVTIAQFAPWNWAPKLGRKIANVVFTGTRLAMGLAGL